MRYSRVEKGKTMARKKQLDKLSLDMIQCAKDGYGVHYGRWKAAQEPVKIIPRTDIPAGWRKCEWCGTPFKPSTKRPQKFCEAYCQVSASQHRLKQRKEAMANAEMP